MNRTIPADIDTYIAGFPKDKQQLLAEMEAEEAIKYAMPTFTFNGSNLVHFAAFKNHIGFYPAPTGIEAFKKELSVYKGSKGAIQFPLDRPLPIALISRIVKFRVKSNREKAKAKAK
jgi:uncharacterized protein YdhG (YjbR/CyaY superfamily)